LAPRIPWPAEVDQHALRQGLEWHAIGPMLYYRARQYHLLGELPAGLRQQLEQTYYRWTALNLAQEAQVVSLVAACRQADIPVILLKGAALLRSVYDQVGLRPMVDIDVLVHTADLDRLRGLLLHQGFLEQPRQRRWECEHHLKFCQPAEVSPGLPLEVHWRLSDKPGLAERLPVADLWARAVPARPPYHGTALVLDPCDTVLHVALHMAEHAGLAQLRRLCDLHLLTRPWSATDDRWNLLAERAVGYHLHLVLAAALHEASRWFGTAVPPPFWEIMARGLPPSPAAEQAYDLCRPRDQLRFQLGELGALRSLPDKLRYLATLLFPRPAYIRQRFRVRHPLMIPVFYGVRLGRGLWSGVKSLVTRTATVTARSTGSLESRENA
jgi:hypothetical protein